jgi:hypothetical protein
LTLPAGLPGGDSHLMIEGDHSLGGKAGLADHELDMSWI